MVDSSTLDIPWHDADAHEVRLRKVICERLAASPPPTMDDCVVATYFLALRTWTLGEAVAEISYHAPGHRDPSLRRAA